MTIQAIGLAIALSAGVDLPARIVPNAVPASQETEVSTDGAQLRFFRFSGSARYDSQAIFEPKDLSCKSQFSAKRISGFGLLWGNSEKYLNIKSGIEVHLDAIVTRAGAIVTETCQPGASFVPESGHSYKVQPIIVGQRCKLAITDSKTGEQPSSYTAYDAVDICAGKFWGRH